jgi:hypothetical protein
MNYRVLFEEEVVVVVVVVVLDGVALCHDLTVP